MQQFNVNTQLREKRARARLSLNSTPLTSCWLRTESLTLKETDRQEAGKRKQERRGRHIPYGRQLKSHLYAAANRGTLNF